MAKALLFPVGCVLVIACGGDVRPGDTDSSAASISAGSDSSGSGSGSTATGVPTTGSTDPSGSGTGVDTVGTTTSPTTSTGTTTVDPATTASTGDDPGMVVSIEIDPLDAIITVIDGQIPAPTQYTAVGVTDKGIKIPVDGTWSYDHPDLAAIGDQSGLLSATGFAGGTGVVNFEGAGDLPAASTNASVKLVFNAEPVPVPPDIKDLFGMAVDPDPSMVLLYPYDQTVFPRGLIGPVIQWDGGGANDTYYIHAYSDYFEYKGYHAVPPPSRFSFPTMPADIWLKLTASTEGPVKVDIARYDGMKAYLAKTQTWTIAPANLTGSVYYWEVNQGNVVRLNIGDNAPQPFINKPPGVTCVACHSVSKDGSRIAASFHGGYSPWSTIEAASGNVLYFPDIASGFQAIAPNGSHVVWGQSSGQAELKLTTFDSNQILGTLGAPGGFAVHPAWSGDSGKIAFARRTDGNWLDFNNSELWLADVDLMTNTFSNVKMIADKVPGLGTTTFPTFAPDSQWIAFNRLNQARTRGAVTEVWITNLDGTAQMRLGRANGLNIIEPGQDQTTYEPTFLPVSVGGYSWLIIGSERKYGNTLTDTNPNSRRKQLWVTAIDANIQPGVDPSHPAFWLPGQELNNSNMRGEWALSPCKQNGEGCNAGFDCCDGFCYGDPPMCSDIPDACSHIGDSCMTDADCCMGEGTCIGGYCSIMPG